LFGRQIERPLYGRLARAASLLAVATAVFCAAAYIVFELVIFSLPPLDLKRADKLSTIILSADGQILKSYLASDDVWRLPATPADVSSNYLKMLLAYEDKRFYRHSGVDVLAVGRAVYQFVRDRTARSGASTLSMQVARLLTRHERGFIGKAKQALLAIKLERQVSKQEILSLYLTLAPFGGNIEGVRAASIEYFGHEPSRLSVGEAALLVALPQSPERRRPRSGELAVQAARNGVLQSLASRHVVSSTIAAAAGQEPVPRNRRMAPHIAHHFGDRMHSQHPSARVIRSLIDKALQIKIEALAMELVDRQPDAANTAVLVVRRRDMAVQAYVGGGSYFRSDRAGMLDLVRGIRSPGSTLKPAIYALAFEDLLIHPETVVIDDVVRFNGYAPENFDKTYRGELTAHDALLQSLNTVPVRLLQQLGPENFLLRLRSAGIVVELSDPGVAPGLAIALGGLGIDLENLAKLYLGIANGGTIRSLRFLVDSAEDAPKRFTSKEASGAVTNILADGGPVNGRAVPLSRDGGRRIAFKTGTSYGFRDAWAVGYDREHLVAVWIGRPDGSSRPGETGGSAAVPLMQQIFELLPVPLHDVAADKPSNQDLARAAGLPERLKRYGALNLDARTGAIGPALQIRFPIDGSVILLPEGQKSPTSITLSARGGRSPYSWFVDGHPVTKASSDSNTAWSPEGRGQVEFVVVDSNGRRAVARVWFD
jgi:penicillin-binding protein 1C